MARSAQENPINDLLLRLVPSESALLDWLRPRIDDTHLHEIASCDGSGPIEENNFQALKRIYIGHPISIPMDWVPLEALEMGRWSDPDRPVLDSAAPEGDATRGHLMRAFCCAVLLTADNSERYICDPESETLFRLLGSVLFLGREASERALRFLCWRTLTLPQEVPETPFCAFVLLLLHAAIFETNEDGTDLRLLAEWVMAEEARVRDSLDTACISDEWLFGLYYWDWRPVAWRRMALGVLQNPAKAFPEPGAASVREIVQRLGPPIPTSWTNIAGE